MEKSNDYEIDLAKNCAVFDKTIVSRSSATSRIHQKEHFSGSSATKGQNSGKLNLCQKIGLFKKEAPTAD